jgi:hypothetical protein
VAKAVLPGCTSLVLTSEYLRAPATKQPYGDEMTNLTTPLTVVERLIRVLTTVRCPVVQFNPVHRPFMAFVHVPKAVVQSLRNQSFNTPIH